MGSNPGQNDLRFDDFMKRVDKRGAEAAAGRDSLPMLALDVVEMAANSVISLDKDTDGKDDAARIYDRYIKADSKKSVHDHTANGVRANASKLRQFIVLGQNPKFDGLSVFNRAVSLRADTLKVNPEAKLLPTYKAMVEFTRVQNKQDVELTDAQILEAITPVARERDNLSVLKQVQRQLDNLVTGEKGIKDDSQEVLDACALINTRVATLELKAKTDVVMAEAAALGLTVAPVTAEAA